MSHLADLRTAMATISHWCSWTVFSSQVNWSSFTEAWSTQVPRSAESKGERCQPSWHTALKLLWTLWTDGEKQTEELNISVVPQSSTPGAAKNKIDKYPHPVMWDVYIYIHIYIYVCVWYHSCCYIYLCLCLHTHTHIYMKKYKESKQSHFKRNTLFL